MPRVFFDPNKDVDWTLYFTSQIGKGDHYRGYDVQYGSGRRGQSGTGIGPSRAQVDYLLPILKSVAREVGREGLAATGRAIADVLSGEDVQTAITKEAVEAGKSLVAKAGSAALKKAVGGKQTGKGKRRPPKKRRSIVDWERRMDGLVVPRKKARPASVWSTAATKRSGGDYLGGW